MKSVTYVIICKEEGMPPFYVGHTSFRRFTEENYHGSPKSRKWKKKWNELVKDKPESFKRKILKVFETKDEAIEHEIEILSHFNAHKSDLFVNMTIGGNKFYRTGPLTKEAKEKMSRSTKGIKKKPETVERMSAAQKGKKKSEEHRKKLSLALKGKSLEQTHRNKISESLKGRVMTEEHKRRLSEARKRTIAAKKLLAQSL
ncbi:homing endonuclease [Agrobacterium phage OLIVR5]|uniref:Homing endonuclease n=1 Tax=Agrobacterium phage OLIVR5 TaxID=2723773 RepID=A0A858MSI3_9CAUD|nr:HNH endonuclease [Agrobacterium phage OLIVR5]QIW87737.1 homing endonuclease [Agrobacterium phage OLIVR5]QIW87999.1 homing endonuclease [Agrobacterium phage OLIVR6]